MNFQQLEYIVAIDEHKLFSEAAFVCNVTQATLSAMVIKLEKELGFPIFDRTTKPVTTTELGQKVVENARQMLSIKGGTFQLGKVIPENLTGHLTLGIIPTIADSLLALFLPQLLKQNPDLHVEIKEITTEDITRQLRMGTIDVGILATPLNEENIDEEIAYYEPMMVYGVTEKATQFIASEEMLDDKIWLLEEGHCFRDQVRNVCGLKQKKASIENLTFEGNSFETLLSMVDAFGGFTLIPELYYQKMTPDRQAKSRGFQKPIPVREVSIVSYAPAQKKLTTQFLAQFIKELVAPKLSTGEYENKDLRIVGF